MNHWPFVLLLALVGTCAQAAGPVYRCGASYSQTPCPGGTLLEAGDPRTAAQRAEARRAAAAERKAARALERDRLAAEKKREPVVASLGPTSAASAPVKTGNKNSGKGKAKPKAQSAEPPFTAVVPDGKK